MTKDIPKRLPQSNVVQGTLPVLNENNADAFFLKPNSFLKIKDGSVTYDNYLTSASAISPIAASQPDLNGLISSSGILPVPIIKPDTVELTDIESITYEQYYDSVSKIVKYKAILKIRNSSINNTEVQGVDARIYNPNA
jgi:hypothetical protein